ncbi:MAG: NUDIX domain-containing protein [Candidatus Limnocylindrus sp.]
MSQGQDRTDPLAREADEMIWGIPRATALPHGAWRGFRAFASREEGDAEIARLEGAVQVRPRRELEMDPEWKQPIPYAIAIFRDATNRAHLFWMDRLEGTSDRRLHGRASFGVGGHIGATDTGIEEALTREWNEEVATPSLPRFTPIGLLNDDGDDVGRVHLGVVYLALLASPVIQVREREKLAGALVPLDEAVARADELEGWSAALIAHIEALAT